MGLNSILSRSAVVEEGSSEFVMGEKKIHFHRIKELKHVILPPFRFTPQDIFPASPLNPILQRSAFSLSPPLQPTLFE